MIALDFILIPSEFLSIPLLGWGINGAAASLLIGQIIQTVLFYTNARKLLQLKAPKGIVPTSCAAALSILAVYALSTYLEISRFYDIIALFLIYAGAFAALAIIFRAITVKELGEMIKMLRPKHLLHRPLR